MRPSSSSSPQSPQVEPGGRCVQRFVTWFLPRPRPVHPTPTALWYFSCTDWSIHTLPMCRDLQPQMEDAPVTIPANQLFFHTENVIIRMERGSGTARREGSP